MQNYFYYEPIAKVRIVLWIFQTFQLPGKILVVWMIL